MRTVDFRAKPKTADSGLTLKLDLCRLCHLLWLDRGEEAILTPRPVAGAKEKPVLAPNDMATYAHALAELSAMSSERDFLASGRTDVAKDLEWWKSVPAWIGLPVEETTLELEQKPYQTWLIAALMTIAFLYSRAKPGVLTEFVYIPSRPLALQLPRAIGSFFLDGNYFHFIENIYFLLIFADDVENDIHGYRFLVVIFGAHLAGVFLQTVFYPTSSVPVIGASAGIYGILGYYMMRFPRRRLAINWRISSRGSWTRFSAKWVLIAKFGWDILVATALPDFFRYDAAPFAQLTGAAFGILCAILIPYSSYEHDFKPLSHHK
jgi:membrane associated rhomboid family serine protease